MTYKTTIHSNPGSRVTANYECPEHGMFTATVERDASGDPPEELPCPHAEDIGSSVKHVIRVLVCGLTSPWRPSSAGAVTVRRGEMVQGKSADRPADRYVMDTRPLADGMPLHEFKERRAKVHRDESLRRVRKAFGKTPKVWSR